MWIYKIKNILNNKVYIGQTTLKYPSMRWQSHKYDAKNKRKDHPLHRAINKYGLNNFEFETIYKSFDIDDLNEKEIYFIKLYNTMDRKFGYNLLPGGRNSKHTDETKRKIGLKSIGRKTFLGKKHTQETKDRIRNINKDRKLTEEHILRLSKEYKFLNSDNELVIIINLKKFCRDNMLDYRTMQRVHKNEMGFYREYRNINNPLKPFYGLNPNNEILKFKRIRDVKEFELSTSKVCLCLKNKRNTHKNWIFSYEKEELYNKLDKRSL